MKNRGFTLIELMITLAIAAILATVAVPAFSGFLARQQLASDVNQMISVLSFARSEAIKQRREIAVIFSPPTSFIANRRPESCRNNESSFEQNGEIFYTYSGWCYLVESDKEGEVLRVGEAANVTVPGNEFKVIFKSLGDADIGDCRPDSSQPCYITISPQRAQSNVIPITLAINITGSIRRKESGL